jgi:hypothetical protein
MSITNRVQCYSYETIDLYSAIIKGKLTFSTDRHLVLLDYDVDNLGISLITEASLDPSVPPAHGILHYNTNNGKVYFCNGDEFVHVGTVLERDGVNVISKGMKAAPETAIEGDQYLISGSPEVAWKQYKNQIARFTGSSWEFSVPEVDQIVGVEDEFVDYKFNGYSWIKQVDTLWVKATPPEGYILEDEGKIVPIVFGESPGVVSSSSSGVSGVAILVSRSDHGHNLGTHLHSDNTNGGQISHSLLLDIGANDHHTQVHSGLDHTGIIGTWAQLNFAASSIGDIANRSHTLLTDIGINTHDQIDAYLANHDHDGENSKMVATIDGGDF